LAAGAAFFGPGLAFAFYGRPVSLGAIEAAIAQGALG